MSREHTHVKALLPKVKEMAEEGKSQREIAEYFGLKDKKVIKELLKRSGCSRTLQKTKEEFQKSEKKINRIKRLK